MKKINIFFIHFLIFANMCKMVLFVSFKIPFYFADYKFIYLQHKNLVLC